MRILLRKSVIPRVHNGILEWSTNGHVFYPINQKRIIPQNNGDFYESFRIAMNKISQGMTELFDGSYDPEKKILTVKKL